MVLLCWFCCFVSTSIVVLELLTVWRIEVSAKSEVIGRYYYRYGSLALVSG